MQSVGQKSSKIETLIDFWWNVKWYSHFEKQFDSSL